MDEMGPPSVAERIIEFLRSIGLAVTLGDVEDEAFLPGIEVVNGGLRVDLGKLSYPGDLLHEAGHLAIVSGESRNHLSGKVEVANAAPQLVELEAMLWSYAAAIHLHLDPRIVFHADGYHGQSESLLRTFGLGIFPGVHGLEESGMTYSPTEAVQIGAQPFPKMRRWLRS